MTLSLEIHYGVKSLAQINNYLIFKAWCRDLVMNLIMCIFLLRRYHPTFLDISGDFNIISGPDRYSLKNPPNYGHFLN